MLSLQGQVSFFGGLIVRARELLEAARVYCLI
jgi:hypothetical protein